MNGNLRGDLSLADRDATKYGPPSRLVYVLALNSMDELLLNSNWKSSQNNLSIRVASAVLNVGNENAVAAGPAC